MTSPASAPLPTLRVLLLIARISLASTLHRLGHLGRRRERPGERPASAPRRGRGALLLGLVALVFVWQTIATTSRLVERVSRQAEQRDHPGQLVLDPVSYYLMARASEQLGSGGGLTAEASALVDVAAERPARALGEVDARARAREMRATLAREGLAGFRESQVAAPGLWPSRELWYSGAERGELLAPLAVVALLLALAQLLTHVAGSDEDLARVGPGLEWLFSFPVRARALFLARAFAAPLSSPLVWVALLPFYAVVYGCSGLGMAGLPLAAASAVYVALWGGGLRVLLETMLRRLLSPLWISRLQATLLAFSLLPLAGAYAIAFSPVTAGALDQARAVPAALLYQPLTLPLLLAEGGARAATAAALGLLALAVWLFSCAAIAERLVRDGVASGGAEHAVVRSAGLARSSRARLLRGAALKEWRALVRDRRTRTQAFIAPALLVGMQLLLNPSLAHAVSTHPRHAATLAFAASAFSLATSAFTALASEGPAVWWLYAAPVELSRALLSKLAVRATLSAAFGLLVLAGAWLKNPALIWPSLPYAALALAGVVLYSVVALGLGALATDVLEPEPRRRVRPGAMYLFLLLSALYGYALSAASWWEICVHLALSALLAFAVWQEVTSRLPFLLDAAEAPSPVISVADGVVVTLAFFVLQALFALPFRGTDLPAPLVFLSTFAAAGWAVSTGALLLLRRRRVPRLMAELGLSRRGDPPVPRLSAIALGVASGVLAAAVALLYLAVARQQPAFARGYAEAVRSATQLDGASRRWLLALAVLVAPPIEELLFRGILYRGLRRSLRPLAAAAVSALVFALIHPAPAAAPVFVLALLAALAYERSGWLLTPILAHMIYNAVSIGRVLLRP